MTPTEGLTDSSTLRVVAVDFVQVLPNYKQYESLHKPSFCPLIEISRKYFTNTNRGHTSITEKGFTVQTSKAGI